MKKKKIAILLLLSFIISIPIDIVNCASVGFASVSSGSSGSSGNNSPPSATATTTSGISKYKLSYTYSISPNTKIDINAYDLNGKSTMSYYKEPIYNTFKSGTPIGISALETRTVTWAVNTSSFGYSETKKKYTCQYETEYETTELFWNSTANPYSYCTKYSQESTRRIDNCETSCAQKSDSGRYKCTDCNAKNQCTCKYEVCTNKETRYAGRWESSRVTKTDDFSKTYEKKYNEEFSCPTTSSGTHGTYKLTDGAFEYVDDPVSASSVPSDARSSLMKTARDDTQRKAESMSYYHTSKLAYIAKDATNNYPKSGVENYLNYIDNPTSEHECKSNGNYSGTETTRFYYDVKNVCMNPQTGKVRYDNDSSGCKNEEIKIKDRTVYEESLGRSVTYWHYFIPLNAKTDSEFYIRLEKNTKDILSKGECLSIIKNYSNKDSKFNFSFDNLITLKDGTKVSSDIKKAEKEVKNGCYITTTINFKVSQKFYNEETENKIFNGLNFYYRQIDPNNPFPNGINNSQLWKSYDSNTINKTMSDSYSKISYIADIPNQTASKIRNYNDKNLYNNFNGISGNGISGFITNYGITRNDTGETYKLAAGPKVTINNKIATIEGGTS